MSEENKNTLLEGEQELLLDHDYDGIQELDNPLPGWWKMTFYGGIVFAVFYFLFYIVLGGPTLYDEYKKELAFIEAVRAEMLGDMEYFDEQDYEVYVLNTPNILERGVAVYVENCLACHADGGIGDIGPNLTDAYWIHGDGSVISNYRLVVVGVEEMGMPPWGEFLTREDVYAVVAYLDSIKNTNLSGKAPEGERID
jgi:cytochrome c oxidase cbb3-type subunit III